MRFVTGPDPGGPPVAQAGDATVPDSPEVGMKRLNALMTEMLAEVEKGDVAERKEGGGVAALAATGHARLQGGARSQEKVLLGHNATHPANRTTQTPSSERVRWAPRLCLAAAA